MPASAVRQLDTGPLTTPHVVRTKRPRDWSGLSAEGVLARHPPGKTPPLRVLEILLTLFNDQHTARYKRVSHKTQHDRAVFLRRFFRDLRARAGFATVPDPRNLGGRHIQAMVNVWRDSAIAAPTLQTYFSFLRGLACWIGKPGLVLHPRAYGVPVQQYQRELVARVDKTWSGAGVDIESVIATIHAFDPHVGAALALIHAFGLRRKEAIMLRPHLCVVPFSSTGLAEDQRRADAYLWIFQGSKGGRPRFVPIVSDRQRQALALARSMAATPQAHVGRADRDLRYNLNRFSQVVRLFGVSRRELGVTTHGLRHEALIELWEQRTGTPPPVRGGPRPATALIQATRSEIAEVAGHGRARAANHYIGSWRKPPFAGVPPTEVEASPSPLQAPRSTPSC